MAKASTKSPKRAAAKPRKAKPAAKAKRGRPPVPFNLDDLEKLGALQCTYADLASFFDCSEVTIKRRMAEDDGKFRERFERGQGKGRISLRRTQWRHTDKSVPMSIFLGKNYLGQSDKIIHEGGDKPIKTQEVSRDPEHLTDLARRIAFILEGAARAKGKKG